MPLRPCSFTPDERSRTDLRRRIRRRSHRSKPIGREDSASTAADGAIRSEPDHRVRQPCGAAGPGIGAAAIVALLASGRPTTVAAPTSRSRAQIRARSPGGRATREASTSGGMALVTAPAAATRPSRPADAQRMHRSTELPLIGDVAVPGRFRAARSDDATLRGRGDALGGSLAEDSLFGPAIGGHGFTDPTTAFATLDPGSGCGNFGADTTAWSGEDGPHDTDGNQAVAPEVGGDAVLLGRRIGTRTQHRSRTWRWRSRTGRVRSRIPQSPASPPMIPGAMHCPGARVRIAFDGPMHDHPSAGIFIARRGGRPSSRPPTQPHAKASRGTYRGEDGSTGTRSRRPSDGGRHRTPSRRIPIS
jgi:hypothetical protein